MPPYIVPITEAPAPFQVCVLPVTYRDLLPLCAAASERDSVVLPDVLAFQLPKLSSNVSLISSTGSAFTTNAANYNKGRTSVSKSMHISPEINVMGMTVAEATQEIDKYLDDACLSHLNKVTIIHGKGTGALRNGIHQYLKKQPHVKSFRAGEFGEGEYGVTIVEL